MISKEEAEEMLVKLAEYYREPVMPVSKYCKAISTWFNCIYERDKDLSYPESTYWDKLFDIEKDIMKSNLLYRLIYNGEELRTEQCPVHKGSWSGWTMGPNDEQCECALTPQGGYTDKTGWLPKKK